MANIKVGFVSLGCPKNAIDCERLLARVHAAGYEITAEETEADVIVVNTCAFIQSAKEEAIETILDLNYLKEHHDLKAIIVTGCLAQRYYEEILKELPEVDSVLSLGGESEIVAAIEAVARGERYDRHSAPETLELEGDRVLIGNEKSAYLKIAEGCDNRCTYCAIPSIRGCFRSRKKEDVLAEAKDLYALGVRELILIAQDTTRYGLDLYGEY
ncbi:MAG: radical SAM protein, partial [Clostridia bacterium]|nr:radical SAM protein [Clostridia bacterium]